MLIVILSQSIKILLKCKDGHPIKMTLYDKKLK